MKANPRSEQFKPGLKEQVVFFTASEQNFWLKPMKNSNICQIKKGNIAPINKIHKKGFQ